MKFKLLSFILFVLIFTGCASLSERTVNVSEAQLQQKLNERLATPISLLKIFDVNLSNSIVKFDGKTGRMITRLDTSLTSLLSEKALVGKLDISGKLRFDVATNSVVLDDPKVENLNLDGLDAKQGEFFNLLAQRLGGEMLNGFSLYTVQSEDLKLGSIQYSPKAIQITDSGLQITFSPIK